MWDFRVTGCHKRIFIVDASNWVKAERQVGGT